MVAGKLLKAASIGLASGSSTSSAAACPGTSRRTIRGGVTPAASPLSSSAMVCSTSSGTPRRRATMFSYWATLAAGMRASSSGASC
jgi:hypothetical protein